MRKLIPLFIVIASVASADPGPATRYLMNEPASLMDIGILRAEVRLSNNAEFLKGVYEESTRAKIVSLNTAIIYDYQDDRLSIEFTPIVRDPGNAQQGCKEVLSESQGWLRGVIPYLFAHEGYRAKSRPDDLQDQIAERTVVYCIAQSAGSHSNIVTVRLPLTSDDMSIIRHGDNQ